MSFGSVQGPVVIHGAVFHLSGIQYIVKISQTQFVLVCLATICLQIQWKKCRLPQFPRVFSIDMTVAQYYSSFYFLFFRFSNHMNPT